MSLAAVRIALETALTSITPAIDTAWQNVSFTPVVGQPYQRVYLLTAEPDNVEIGPGYTEQGIMQVSLCYPLGIGPQDATKRAEQIRATFKRGASFTASGVTVHIDRTPEISPAQIEEDRFVLPVRIRFFAHVGG